MIPNGFSKSFTHSSGASIIKHYCLGLYIYNYFENQNKTDTKKEVMLLKNLRSKCVIR